MSDVRCWATSTDLAGSAQQQRRYFLAIEEDDGARRDVELVIGPGPTMAVEPFNVRDMNYTVHDSCDHENEYCVLEDPDTPEYEDERVNEAFFFDTREHTQEPIVRDCPHCGGAHYTGQVCPLAPQAEQAQQEYEDTRKYMEHHSNAWLLTIKSYVTGLIQK